jgi:hypothetical protein
MERFFKGFIVQYIERTKNEHADELAKATARKAVLPPDVFFQLIKDPSIKIVKPEPRMVNIIQGEDWRAPIMPYLRNHYEPDCNATKGKIIPNNQGRVVQEISNRTTPSLSEER